MKEAGRAMVIDFSAAWCSPCLAMDRTTFHDPVVVERTASEVVMVKVDLTNRRNALHEELLRELDVKGVPTLVFLDHEGKERRDLRAVNYLPPDRFLVRLTEVTRSTAP